MSSCYLMLCKGSLLVHVTAAGTVKLKVTGGGGVQVRGPINVAHLTVARLTAPP